MGTTVDKPRTRGEISDQDLVELAGKHAYAEVKEEEIVYINDNSYLVLETNYDEFKSGMDAFVVQNLATEECALIFIGSVGKDDWIGTNPRLLSNVYPEQMEDAIAYYEASKEKYNITAVAGNSLGGANTNAVGVKYPDVRAVSLNPALLPEDKEVDFDKEYPNITNYYSQYDFLTATIQSLEYGHRIPGKKYHINNGLPVAGLIGPNHTGYISGELYEVGKKGEPGHGFINVDADDFIVRSIWTGEPIYRGSTERIEINRGSMLQFAEGLEQHVQSRIDTVHTYLGNSVAIVEDEHEKYEQRVAALREEFTRLIEEAAGEPIFTGLAAGGALLKTAIDTLISLLNEIETRCRVLNMVLNSAPMELIESLFSLDISVESIIGAMRNQLNELKGGIDSFIELFHDILTEGIPELFINSKFMFADAIAEEMHAHYQIIDGNRGKVKSHVGDFTLQVSGTAEAFMNRDERLSEAVKGASSSVGAVDQVQKTNAYVLDESPYMVIGMKIRSSQTDAAHVMIVTVGTQKLLPLLTMVKGIIVIIEAFLEQLILIINSARKVALYGTPVNLALSLFTSYKERVNKAVDDALKPVEELEGTLEGVRKGIGQLIENLPQVLNNFKPYIETALFGDDKYSNVHLYNVASLALLEDTELLFKDIISQLSGHKANAIVTLCSVSEKLNENIKIFKEQVSRTTIT